MQKISTLALRQAKEAHLQSLFKTIQVNGASYPTDSWTNIPKSILDRSSARLLSVPNHPLSILKRRIQSIFPPSFEIYDNLDPVVSTFQNFDSLLVPQDHISRSKHDTYYLNSNQILRTHSSAHQLDCISKSNEFLVFADVYRRDEIDSSHFPVFHQLEGVRLFHPTDFASIFDKASINTHLDNRLQLQVAHEEMEREILHVSHDLKTVLEKLVNGLFGHDSQLECRWVDAYFPFTCPSWELEIKYRGKWMEVAGCGVIQNDIMKQAGKEKSLGWAFGIGLERIAMVLFDIPDIRLFWSQDERFLKQFEKGEIVKYKPISKYPAVYKDISFWIPLDSTFHQNDFFELVREHAGDLVEDVSLIDEFTHPRTKKSSKCFRVMYRSLERTLENEEINITQDKVIEKLKGEMGLDIR